MTGQTSADESSKSAATAQAKRFLLLLALILLLSTAVSLYLDLRVIGVKYRTLATELGRSFYQAIDTMRDWNLEQGGIYILAGENAAPNPYLPESLRTIVSADGRTLVMINHAHMTRIFSELLTQDRGIHLHITSPWPLRPDNRPDDWERKALAGFQRGNAETSDVVGEGDKSVFRYMAPLHKEERCVICHANEKDSNDPVRGGIGVSFSYAPFQRAMTSEVRQNTVVHLTFFSFGVVLIIVMGSKMLQNIGKLQDALLQVKRLEGFLPICASCKRIRLKGSDHHDPNSWVAIEKYIEERTDAEFTHGLCPHCAKSLYPNYFPG